MTFTVFLLSGVLLLTSGGFEVITTRKPFDNEALCEAAAAQVREFVAMREDVVSGVWGCKPYELPVVSEPVEPKRDAAG